jgi:hypothetical protein
MWYNARIAAITMDLHNIPQQRKHLWYIALNESNKGNTLGICSATGRNQPAERRWNHVSE